MISGIIFGLAAAFCQSLSYLASRMFAATYHRGTILLLALGHTIMGAFAVLLLLVLWPTPMPEWRTYVWPLLGSAAFYLFGQLSLFLALQRTDASRVSPLLGLKVLMLALISVLFMRGHFTLLQWAAVFLSVLAAATLNRSGGRLPLSAMLWILLACVNYCISDISITFLVPAFAALGLFRACLVSVCLAYALCGLVGVLMLPWVSRPSAKMWRDALPFAVSWFVSMVFLFACFASIGVVFGNIVQSSRGVVSIMLGSLVARAGWEHLETRIPRRVLVRRMCGALLMVLAIALFCTAA